MARLHFIPTSGVEFTMVVKMISFISYSHDLLVNPCENPYGCWWPSVFFGQCSNLVPAQCQDLSHFASATLSLVDLARDQELTSLECCLDRKARSVPWSTTAWDIFLFFGGENLGRNVWTIGWYMDDEWMKMVLFWDILFISFIVISYYIRTLLRVPVLNSLEMFMMSKCLIWDGRMPLRVF
jgi:hypothetical protein